MGLVGLFFLSHSHYLFYKPYPSFGKRISLIKNDTVEKVWTHHAKSFPVPGEIKAKDRLREKSFLALPGSLAVWHSHAEYRYTNTGTFLLTKDEFIVYRRGAKIPGRPFSRHPCRLRAGDGACCPIYGMIHDWPFLLF